jgi:hypothetical protein
MLSGRDDDWTEAQLERVEQGLFFDPIPASATLQPLIDESQIINIALDPQYRTATLLVEQPYVATDAQGFATTIMLQHTYIYRRGAQRWLLSPPEPSFWGQQGQIEGAVLTLDYPQRDEEIARRLATDLEAKLNEICQIPIPIRAGCPSDLHVHLRLSSQPKSLLALADREQWLKSGTELVLPTPTLVGMPATEAAYQALFRYYAAQVLSATITHLTGYHCCIYRAVLEKQLNQLGVSPWPLTTTDFLKLLPHFAPLRELEMVWLLSPQETLTEAELLLQYALVDILVEERDLQPAALLTWRQNLITWLPTAEESAETVWWKYIYEQAMRAQSTISSTPPYPWPEQNLYLTCQNDEGVSGLYRYVVAADTWTRERILGERSAALLPLPDDNGMVISVGSLPEKETFVLRQDGTEYPISVEPGSVSLPAGAITDPAGRYLQLQYTSNAPNVFRMVYLDVDSCNERGCDLIPADQGAIWSPDGSQLLLWVNGRLQRGSDLNGPWTPVSPSGVHSPFWWRNNIPGYVTGLGDRIMIVPSGSEHSAVWLTVDNLATVAPSEIPEGSWRIQEVYTTPNVATFLISARLRGQPGYHLFLVRDDEDNTGQTVDESTAPTVFYLVGLPRLPVTLSFSPDGHWLAMPIFEGDATDRERFLLYDLRVPERVLESQLPFPTTVHNLDWSADGRWLVRIGDGFLEFTAPVSGEESYWHYTSLDDLSCSSLAWVE